MADSTWKSVMVLYCTVFADLLGFGIMIPLLPYFAFQFGAGSAALGVMATAFSGFQMVGNVTLGLASDRLGRKPVLCACLFGSAASYLAFGFASSLQVLIISRALSGFFSGTVGCAQAYVSAAVPAKERGQYLGYIGACIGAGFACGPGIGGLLAHVWGFDGPCFFATGLCLLNGFAAVLFLREPQVAETPTLAPKREPLLSTSPAAAPTGNASTPASKSMGLVTLLRERPQCFPVLVSTAAYYLAFAIFDAAGALYFHDAFGMTAGQFGGLSTLAGIGALVMQKFCVRGTINSLGEVWAGATAHLIRLVAYLLVAVCHASWAPYLMGFLISGGSILAPCSATLLSALAPEQARGAVLGLNQSFAALGRVVGPIVAAVVYPYCAEAIWYAAVASSFFGAVALMGVRKYVETAASPVAVAATASSSEPKAADVEGPERRDSFRSSSTASSSCSDREERRSATPPSTPTTDQRPHFSPESSVVASESEGEEDGIATRIPATVLPKVPGFPVGDEADLEACRE